QAFWIPIGLIPWFLPVPGTTAIYWLLGLMAIRAAIVAATNCSWNSWLRDLIPRKTLNSTMARRMAVTTVVSAIVGLSGALFLDWWKVEFPDAVPEGYAWLFLVGAVLLGMASPVFMACMPEPLMPPRDVLQSSLRSIMAVPLRDVNFRRLARFLFVWTFAANLALPFFAVYMLRRLGMPLTQVMLLTMLSQISNLLLLRLWGPLADRFGSKAVLSLSITIYLIVFVGWVFTTLPDRHALTLPMLVVLHLLMGIATAGVSFTTTTIGMKLAPPGQATGYLAVSSLAINIGTGLGPLVGGPLGDYFSQRKLSLNFQWTDPGQRLQLSAFDVTGFDFLFLMSAGLGLVALAFLARVREEGEVSREEVLDEMWEQTRLQFRTVSSAPRLGLFGLPVAIARRIPGLDIALGVTAYQVASVMKATVATLGHGRRAIAAISGRVSEALSGLLAGGEDVSEVGSELGRHAVRGAIQATNPDDQKNVGPITTETIKGVFASLEKVSVKSTDVLFGAGYGAVQGAVETDTNVYEAVNGAIKGAKAAATKSGLDPLTAETATMQGALAAVAAMTPTLRSEVVSRVQDSFPELVIAHKTED
ncbi:MAG: MFS transporter, partial [Planctomycetota bacterium]|nr:MFS transporter [Planctomycetota bacterium]